MCHTFFIQSSTDAFLTLPHPFFNFSPEITQFTNGQQRMTMMMEVEANVMVMTAAIIQSIMLYMSGAQRNLGHIGSDQ